MILRIDNPPGEPAAREDILREALPAVRESGVVVVMAGVATVMRGVQRPRSVPRGAVFDLDATLIACEFVDRLAGRRGVEHLTRGLTERAMSGGMDFRESYLRRMEMLGGVAVDEIDRLIDTLPLAPGAERAIDALHRAGVHTAIITGGYARVGRAVGQRLGIGALYATEIEERDGVMTGRTAGPTLDEEGKVEALRDFCAVRGLDPDEVVAVGDGANDLRMLSHAGTAILYTSVPRIPGRVVALDEVVREIFGEDAGEGAGGAK